MAISASLRRQVTKRASGRCEYCGLASVGQAATFHLDHVIPQIAGGATELENLALACIHCSLRKGARTSAIDQKTGKVVPLFHPRRDWWSRNFRWSGKQIIGRTSTGRATVDALDLNNPDHLVIRGFEERLGRHPPPDPT
ncbi:HNH endonuclease signature motif containing protein [Luteolibacter flavescens]|uniref:HNH endonuclease n=1 Tax=Luteolibacter flavescens TaxID=1859460 RepID=UPI0031BAC09D